MELTDDMIPIDSDCFTLEQSYPEKRNEATDMKKTLPLECSQEADDLCDSGFLENFNSGCSLHDRRNQDGQEGDMDIAETRASLWRFLSEDQDTFLHLCIIHESEDRALSIIHQASPSFLNFQNTLYQTPLHLAVYLRLVKTVRDLVLWGADTNLQDWNGNTPLHLACDYGYVDCLQALTKPPTDEEQLQRPQQLIDRPDLKKHNWRGHACIHIAVLQGNYQMLEILLSLGADINAEEVTWGRRPLHLATENNDIKMVSLLLERGAQVDSETYSGVTPVELAIGRGNGQLAVELQHASMIINGCFFDDLKLRGLPLTSH
ncbi:NF-kappa-B inhibitor alpha-like isoform X1 [Polypterus senegalus]|uniref:NF-kappa-B inhibitor alpha-like isoform X1 n=1 Tax=Polypterus senegalus TaxID=55291 RepID=UPI001964CAEB|nr:NF-kappa-B inhibitor alpha-like isoform X1 [Polypterus senegalus]